MNTFKAVALAAAGVLAFGIAGCGGDGSDPSAPAEQIPVKVGLDGVNVEVSVGGGSVVPVQLDTGSTGLRIFKESLGDDAKSQKDKSISISYGGGDIWDGYLASATVKIGSVETSSPIDVQVVEKVSCVGGEQCAASSGIKGYTDPEGGYYGIMGVDLVPGIDSDNGGATVINPLASVDGFETYTVDLTGCFASSSEQSACAVSAGIPSGSTATGQWQLIELTPASGSPVPAAPNGLNYWATAVSACWAYNNRDAQCVATIFDSGTPAMQVTAGAVNGLPNKDTTIPEGNTWDFYGDASKGNPLWTLTAGDDDSSLPPDVIVLDPSSDNGCKNEPQDKDSWRDCNSEVIAGLPIWSEFMFSYDLKDGILALYSKR